MWALVEIHFCVKWISLHIVMVFIYFISLQMFWYAFVRKWNSVCTCALHLCIQNVGASQLCVFTMIWYCKRMLSGASTMPDATNKFVNKQKIFLITFDFWPVHTLLEFICIPINMAKTNTCAHLQRCSSLIVLINIKSRKINFNFIWWAELPLLLNG